MNVTTLIAERRWLIIAVAACAIVILYTASPIFQNPQFDPDDYRYLEMVHYLKQDFSGNFLKLSVIENGWDHLWWINVHQKVRFFRPIVILSYWLDVTIYGSYKPLGFLITNILIYAGCVFLCCLIYFRWVGPGISFFLSSILFAAFFSHGGVMWYVSGRADSLAALFLLSCLALHIYGKVRPSLRWLAVLSFVLALLTKELAAVLPPFLFLSDLLIEKRSKNLVTLVKKEWKLYAVYVIAVGCFFLIRSEMISSPDAGYPFPYFVTLGNPNFLSHFLGQANNYCANLFFAVVTVPFIINTNFQGLENPAGILSGIGFFCLCSFFLHDQKKYWLLLLFGLACWVPTIMLYQSERYLFLPSFAVAGVVGLLLSKFKQGNRRIYYLSLLACLAWITHQAYSLELKNFRVSSEARLPENMGEQLGRIKSSIPEGSKILLLNFPGILLQDQFAGSQLRVQLDDPNLDVTILSPMPMLGDMGADLFVRKDSENVITVRDTALTPVIAQRDDQFPWVTLGTGSMYDTPDGIRIEVLDGTRTAGNVLRFTLPRPVSNYIFLKWDPATSTASSILQFTPSGRELYSTVRILSP